MNGGHKIRVEKTGEFCGQVFIDEIPARFVQSVDWAMSIGEPSLFTLTIIPESVEIIENPAAN